LAGNEFHANAEINVENLNINTSDPFRQPGDRDERIKSVCERLKQFLGRGGRMMVVLNHASLQEQSHFWAHFWHDGLENLLPNGLLVIQMVDRSHGKPAYHDFASDPDLSINLPAMLDEARSDNAFDDLTEILSKEIPGLSPEAIWAAANAHLSNNEESVKKLHDNLSKLIVKLSQGNRYGA
jgi:hypothetical protein